MYLCFFFQVRSKLFTGILVFDDLKVIVLTQIGMNENPQR